MADESTPLTSALPPGPSDVFPGGVSPHSRRNKMLKFECCMCSIFIGILLVALIATLLYGNVWSGSSLFLLIEDAEDYNTPSLGAEPIVADTALPDEPDTTWALQKIKLNKSDNEAALNAGFKALGDREILEESSAITPVNSPAFRHYRSLSTNREARKLARRGYVENHATLGIAKIFNYTKPLGRSNIGRGPNISMLDPTLNFHCDFNARYRSTNGLCNNKIHPRYYGAALTPYRRMVAPDYADGISLPRASHSGAVLPAARQVSLQIHRPSYITDSQFTVMLAVFGQFLDHDITATAPTVSQEGEPINCCSEPRNELPECLAVSIAPDDPYYKRFNVTCMNFVRSASAPTGHFGPSEQLNQATAFIDGSVVYGSTDQRQQQLRTHTNGTLRMFRTESGRQLLPISTDMDDGCNRVRMSSIGRYCFESGDDRANENLLLTSMHLLFARHHNHLAQGLQRENPEWSDELVFQEARKILGAQLAHITYSEFLPILLGRDLTERKGLLPSVDDLNAPDTYDPTIDPTIANSFAAAAFRFAHTLLPGLLKMTRDNRSSESVALHEILFNPFSLWQERGFDYAIETAINTPVLRVDRFFSVEVTQRLFEGTSDDLAPPICGLDLVSLNIQRGRDHGLPSYPVFRRHCRLPKANTWEEMATALDPSSLKSIREIYATPLDVDVYTGALSEPPLKGSIFGPLLTCLVSDQFLRLKRGDSHWYERKIGPNKFTRDQLRAIYGTSLAAIICRSTDALESVQRRVMERHNNETVNCKQLESFNFTAWRTQPESTKLHRSSISTSGKRVRVINKASDNSTAASSMLEGA